MDQSHDRTSSDTTTRKLAEWPDAEVFFLTAFRCWLAGYETGDVACWELAWQGASRLLPLADVKRTIVEVGQFTRMFRQTLGRSFTYLPYCCGRVTAEECLAVQLVGAAQRGELVAAGQLAHRLTGNDDHVGFVDAACDLGSAFKQSGLTFGLAAAPIRTGVARRGLH
jgi:hypothetical protein